MDKEEKRIRVAIISCKNADEATQCAVDWQNWSSEQSLSYGELAVWGVVFSELAARFDLTEEFHENGII